MNKFKKLFLRLGLAASSLTVFAGCGSSPSAMDYGKTLSDFVAWVNKTFTQQNEKSKDYKHPYAVRDILNRQINSSSKKLDLGKLQPPSSHLKEKDFEYQGDSNFKISSTTPIQNFSLTFSQSSTKDKDGNPIPDFVTIDFYIQVIFSKSPFQEYLNNSQDGVILKFEWDGKSYKNGDDPFGNVKFIFLPNVYINHLPSDSS